MWLGCPIDYIVNIYISVKIIYQIRDYIFKIKQRYIFKNRFVVYTINKTNYTKGNHIL